MSENSCKPKASVSEANALQELRERVYEVRRVWKRTIFLTGCAVVLFSLIAIFLGEIILDLLMPLPMIIRAIFLAGIVASFGYLVYRFIVKPVRKKLPEHDVALHIEQHYTDLEDRLVSSLQFGGQEQEDAIASHLINRLVADTAERTKELDFKKTISKKKLQDYWKIALLAVAVILLCVFIFPSQLNQALSRILVPWEKMKPVMATKFTVSPGNAKILSGQNQLIDVKVSGRSIPTVTLYYKQGESDWKDVDMMPAVENKRRFTYELFNITQTQQYYVAGKNAKSEIYTINVYEMPKITQIDVSYTYPEYTKLKPIVQQGEGNIRAVVGTEVQIRATTNKGIAEATLNLGGKEPKPMAITAGRTLTCELTVLEDSKYTINVTCVDGFKNQDPIEYTITALKDEPPKVVITKPGRDINATKVEEVDIVVEATDDFGIASVDLKYAVGINQEASAPLELSKSPRPGGDSKKISGTYTFFLEEMNIEPGDVITYHAEALDNNTRSGPSKGLSEIYFIEIRSFKERFEEMNAQSGESDATSDLLSGLITEQKRVIRETWKLDNSRPSPVTKDYEFDVKKQGDAQTKLRDKLQQVISEINSFMRTGMIEPEALNNFENAADEMDVASDELFAIKTSAALPHQQKALEYLNKALLDIPKILLRMQQSFNPQIAENLELNMENLQNQFENQENKLDEQMHKQTKAMLEQARDMLEKQQQLTQQSRDMSKESQPSQQQMNQMSQQESQLSQQASQMAQQLSNMAQNNSFMSPQASRQMEQAAQQMQSASQNLTDDSKQSQEGRQQEALQMSAAKGAKAEENLQKAIEELEKANASFTAEALKDAAERLQRMMSQQEKLKQETEQLEQQTQRDGVNAEDRREVNRMAGQQQQMRNNLNRLQRDLENLNNNLRNSSPEASKHVERALGTIRKDEVKRDMTEVQRNLQWQNFEFAKQKQEEVLNSLSNMEDELQSARTKLATTEEERLENALEQLAKWQEKLEDIRREMEALKDQKPLTQEQQKRLQELAQQQAELRERAEQMRELADALNLNNQWRDWTQAMHNWRGTFNSRFADYDMALRNLNILRQTMEKRLDLIQEKKRLAQVRQEDVPPEYRPLVDSYYELLSE
ncbi:hypothetical protein FJZ31_41900 [Candidatus Poribacteria bacterium]|nr:hypothetical protein [Candidatus Poribacteria bacterium]